MKRLVVFVVALAANALAVTAFCSAATIMVLSDSAGVYLIDTTTGAVVQSYGSLFSGSSAQDLAEDLNGNLFVTSSGNSLLESAFNPTTKYSTTPTTLGSVTVNPARLAWDPTTLHCPSGGCLVGINTANTALDWINASTGAIIATKTLSTTVSGSGDLAVLPTGTASETIYVVATQKLYTINGSTGNVTGPVTISGPTGSLTGLAIIPNGHLVACEQIGSGSPWTLWEFTTAGTVVTSHTGISTGSDVVNDLASVPAIFTTSKSGPSAAGPGDTVSYTITMTNTGYFTDPSASIVDPVPSTMTITNETCSVAGGGSCTTSISGNTVTGSVTSLAMNAVATLTITATPNATSGTATNTETSSVPYDPNEYGGMSLTSSTSTTLTAAEMTKTVQDLTAGHTFGPTTNPGNGYPGDKLQYALSFTNHRGFALQTFSMSDVVPTGTNYVAGSAACSVTAGLTCTPTYSAGTVTWTFTGGSLAAGSTVTVIFDVTIP